MPKTTANPADDSSAHVSLRTIARAAGVSAMTVSKALRNVPKVSLQTRARILRIAARVGYRPDPEVAKLMVHLRRRHTANSFHGLICALTDRPADMSHPYIDRLIAGAEQQTRAWGYGFSVLNFKTGADERRQLRRIVWARGVQGVLLLPMREPVDLSDLLPWSDLAVISATLSLLGPAVHRVIPNHFANALQLCRELSQRGYRRVGLVIDAVQERRVNHGFSAAIVRHNFGDGRVIVPPYIYEDLDPLALRQWYEAERPDAVIATDEALARKYARLLRRNIPGGVGFASTNTIAPSPISGIEERPDVVGSTAASVLVRMIQHGERGLPTHPTTTQVDGAWCEGISCPLRRDAGKPTCPTGAKR